MGNSAPKAGVTPHCKGGSTLCLIKLACFFMALPCNLTVVAQSQTADYLSCYEEKIRLSESNYMTSQDAIVNASSCNLDSLNPP